MFYLLHIIVLLVFYSILFGWRAHRLRFIAKLTEEDNQNFYISQLLFYLLYSNFLILVGLISDGIFFFSLSALLNLVMVDFYWIKNERFRNYLGNSLVTSTIRVVLISFVAAISLWYSGVIIEEITWVPASTLSNTVLVFSIVLSIIIYLGIFMFSVQALVTWLTLVVMVDLVKKKTYKFLVELIVTALFVVPCLFLFSFLSNTVFSTVFIQNKLYESYHSNRSKHCEKLPPYAKFKPISDSSVSYTVLISPNGGYRFDIGDCH